MELKISSGAQRMNIKFPSTEIGQFATFLLGNAKAAYSINQNITGDAQTQRAANKPITAFIPADALTVGTINNRQRVILVKVGDTQFALSLDEAQLRGLSRYISNAFWKTGSTTASHVLLFSIVKDFFEDLHNWVLLITPRIKYEWKYHSQKITSLLMGRSLRIINEIKFVPNVGFKQYDSVRKCIYCGRTTYSDKPLVRKYPLGNEHIIPESVGAQLELPEASCQKHETITGAQVEGDVLGRTLRALRIHLGLRGSGGRPTPKTLPLTKTEQTPEENVEIPIADYPIMIGMPFFGPPAVFSGGAGGNQIMMGVTIIQQNFNQERLAKVYGVMSFATAHWDTHMLYRMLAKIGHALATAEKPEKFKPLLLELIDKGTPGFFNHIGGDPYISKLKKSDHLHELGLGYQRANGIDYLVAKIRLFAKYGGPVYYVVVGESLESPIAKFKSSFSSKISSMLRR